jgi:hypothetical protein
MVMCLPIPFHARLLLFSVPHFDFDAFVLVNRMGSLWMAIGPPPLRHFRFYFPVDFDASGPMWSFGCEWTVCGRPRMLWRQSWWWMWTRSFDDVDLNLVFPLPCLGRHCRDAFDYWDFYYLHRASDDFE